MTFLRFLCYIGEIYLFVAWTAMTVCRILDYINFAHLHKDELKLHHDLFMITGTFVWMGVANFFACIYYFQRLCKRNEFFNLRPQACVIVVCSFIFAAGHTLLYFTMEGTHLFRFILAQIVAYSIVPLFFALIYFLQFHELQKSGVGNKEIFAQANEDKKKEMILNELAAHRRQTSLDRQQNKSLLGRISRRLSRIGSKVDQPGKGSGTAN